jgi:hypothetical protein
MATVEEQTLDFDARVLAKAIIDATDEINRLREQIVKYQYNYKLKIAKLVTLQGKRKAATEEKDEEDPDSASE